MLETQSDTRFFWPEHIASIHAHENVIFDFFLLFNQFPT